MIECKIFSRQKKTSALAGVKSIIQSDLFAPSTSDNDYPLVFIFL